VRVMEGVQGWDMGGVLCGHSIGGSRWHRCKQTHMRV
jgi:hypothetical protein